MMALFSPLSVSAAARVSVSFRKRALRREKREERRYISLLAALPCQHAGAFTLAVLMLSFSEYFSTNRILFQILFFCHVITGLSLIFIRFLLRVSL